MEETKGFVSARDALAALEQYQGCFFPHSAAVKIINQLSREDVELVVHAKWISEREKDTFGYLYHLKCSACDRRNTNKTPYCPNCGAKMDLEGF